jgi:hypothetical protein
MHSPSLRDDHHREELDALLSGAKVSEYEILTAEAHGSDIVTTPTLAL